MCLTILRDSRFFDILLQYDHDMAARAREGGCPCGAALHTANYLRKPRGGRSDLGREHDTRLSLCCAREGCRRRATPPSVRFLGRRVYLGAVVVLASAMAGGITAKRAERLQALLGVSLRTLKRWRAWWRDAFPAGAFWKSARGYFVPPVDTRALPFALLERFGGEDESARLIQALTFLTPLTTGSVAMPTGWSRVLENPQKMRLERTDVRS